MTPSKEKTPGVSCSSSEGENRNDNPTKETILISTVSPTTTSAFEDLDAIARATPCKYADCDGGSHEAVTPPEEWWHEAVTASFDDGIVTASICDMRGHFEGYIDFEGNGTMTAAEFRTAAIEYEAFPAWLRSMADRLDALSTAGASL